MTPPVRRFRFDTGHNVTLLGDAFHETRQQSLLSGVIKLTENLFLLRGSMVISLYTPGHAAGTPVRAFEASWTHYIGRGNGADGYSFCFGDLRDEDGGELLYAFDEMGHGDGLQVTAPAHAHRPAPHALAPTALPPQGTKQDTASALGWFAAAGELGHCSARSRIVAEGFGGLPACIYERLEEV